MPRWVWTVVLGLLAVLVTAHAAVRVYPALIDLLPIAGEDP